tara:strand:+ start:110 stop:880 length:771 start_codon:yes stop_codon:yes gene_type:complete
MKKIVQNFLNTFGYQLSKTETVSATNLDKIAKLLISKTEPTIFDVGANMGESIQRYKNLYPKSKIHSFEPNKDENDKLIVKYKNYKEIYFNNFAIGEKEGNSDFYINAISGHSSFNDIIPNTQWLKARSRTAGVDSKNYTIKKVNTRISTLDNYCEKNKIEQIDLLKIDTQGYEDKVLEGASKLLKSGKIKFIQLELIFSEVYRNTLSIYDVEKHLIPNKYKLFATTPAGSLSQNYKYQVEHVYISRDLYENFKKR